MSLFVFIIMTRQPLLKKELDSSARGEVSAKNTARTHDVVQLSPLLDERFSVAERQMMAAGMGQQYGNQHLAQMLGGGKPAAVQLTPETDDKKAESLALGLKEFNDLASYRDEYNLRNAPPEKPMSHEAQFQLPLGMLFEAKQLRWGAEVETEEAKAFRKWQTLGDFVGAAVADMMPFQEHDNLKQFQIEQLQRQLNRYTDAVSLWRIARGDYKAMLTEYQKLGGDTTLIQEVQDNLRAVDSEMVEMIPRLQLEISQLAGGTDVLGGIEQKKALTDSLSKVQELAGVLDKAGSAATTVNQFTEIEPLEKMLGWSGRIKLALEASYTIPEARQKLKAENVSLADTVQTWYDVANHVMSLVNDGLTPILGQMSNGLTWALRSGLITGDSSLRAALQFIKFSESLGNYVGPVAGYLSLLTGGVTIATELPSLIEHIQNNDAEKSMESGLKMGTAGLGMYFSGSGLMAANTLAAQGLILGESTGLAGMGGTVGASAAASPIAVIGGLLMAEVAAAGYILVQTSKSMKAIQDQVLLAKIEGFQADAESALSEAEKFGLAFEQYAFLSASEDPIQQALADAYYRKVQECVIPLHNAMGQVMSAVVNGFISRDGRLRHAYNKGFGSAEMVQSMSQYMQGKPESSLVDHARKLKDYLNPMAQGVAEVIAEANLIAADDKVGWF